MDIKNFQKGQSAYMLNKNHGYNKPPEVFSADDGYLKEHTDYGGRRLFFKDEKEVTDHLEWMELESWLYKNNSMMHQLSHRQLRAIKSFRI